MATTTKKATTKKTTTKKATPKKAAPKKATTKKATTKKATAKKSPVKTKAAPKRAAPKAKAFKSPAAKKRAKANDVKGEFAPFTVIPDFRDALPKLDPEVYEALKADIAKAKRLYDPIKIAGTTTNVVDGHHRLAIAKELGFNLHDPNVVPREQLAFLGYYTKAQTIDWIRKHQGNKRNLGKAELAKMFAGKVKEAAADTKRGRPSTKATPSGPKAPVDDAPKASPPKKGKATAQVAAAEGVSTSTVERSVRDAKSLETCIVPIVEMFDKSKLNSAAIAILSRCHGDVQKLFANDKITLEHAANASKQTAEKQAEMARLVRVGQDPIRAGFGTSLKPSSAAGKKGTKAKPPVVEFEPAPVAKMIKDKHVGPLMRALADLRVEITGKQKATDSDVNYNRASKACGTILKALEAMSKGKS